MTDQAHDDAILGAHTRTTWQARNDPELRARLSTDQLAALGHAETRYEAGDETSCWGEKAVSGRHQGRLRMALPRGAR